MKLLSSLATVQASDVCIGCAMTWN